MECNRGSERGKFVEKTSVFIDGGNDIPRMGIGKSRFNLRADDENAVRYNPRPNRFDGL